MGNEVIDETRFVRMPEEEFVGHPVRVGEKRSCARDEFPVRQPREYRMFKIRWLDEQGDSGWQRSVDTSQPFPYFRH